jgi:hypothetical protein
MRTHIDWLTFTMRPLYMSSYAESTPEYEKYTGSIENAFFDTFNEGVMAMAFGGTWERQERSRAPYTDAWHLGNSGIVVFASPDLTHCCVEISGAGCERLIKLDVMDVVLRAIHERVTRIDIACDIETLTQPDGFVSVLKHKRMRASGYQASQTGTTCYVGSKTSDRYARVYRYNPPHPRSHLLRIEHVFRRQYAKVIAKECSNGNIEAISAAAGQAFGWAHPDWKPTDSQFVDISIVGSEREAGKTLYWLVNSCAPAFKRLVESGAIRNPEEFINRYFLSDDEPDLTNGL